MKDLKENKMTQKTKRVKNRLFIKGLIFILPVFLTFWISYKIVIFMSSIIPTSFIDKIITIGNINLIQFESVRILLGFFLTVLSIYFIGLTLSIIGKKFFNKIENKIILKIPFLNVIYKTIKQIIDSVSSPDKNSFKKVVMVEYPRKGVWTMGFVTGESEDKNKREYYHIIVPTTPNPTSAFLLFIPKGEVRETNISIDEGIKTIISGGVLSSDKNQI